MVVCRITRSLCGGCIFYGCACLVSRMEYFKRGLFSVSISVLCTSNVLDASLDLLLDGMAGTWGWGGCVTYCCKVIRIVSGRWNHCIWNVNRPMMEVNQAGQTTRHGVMLWVAWGGMRLVVFATVGAQQTPVAPHPSRAVQISKHEVGTSFVSCRRTAGMLSWTKIAIWTAVMKTITCNNCTTTTTTTDNKNNSFYFIDSSG